MAYSYTKKVGTDDTWTIKRDGVGILDVHAPTNPEAHGHLGTPTWLAWINAGNGTIDENSKTVVIPSLSKNWTILPDRTTAAPTITTAAATAPVGPVLGDMWISPAGPQVWSGSAWVLAAGAPGPSGIGAWSSVTKSTDTTRTSNAVIASDPDLLFAMAASTRYKFRGRIFFDTSAAGDFKWRHTGPASPTLVRIFREAVAPAATTISAVGVDSAYSAADIAVLGTGTTGGYIEFSGIIYNGLNAGNFAFQWAQNTSDVGNTTVKAGSHIEFITF